MRRFRYTGYWHLPDMPSAMFTTIVDFWADNHDDALALIDSDDQEEVAQAEQTMWEKGFKPDGDRDHEEVKFQ